MLRHDDFAGFTFNGVHTSELHIYHISMSNRYTENIVPNFTDRTTTIPGSDGTLYWDTNYTMKPFTINIAFDNVNEDILRKMRNLYNAKNFGKLILDETPYKYYYVKITAPIQLKYLCFMENNRRIYKGEGTIQMTAYRPYGRSTVKYINEMENPDDGTWKKEFGNVDEWRPYWTFNLSSGIQDDYILEPADVHTYIYYGGNASITAYPEINLKNSIEILETDVFNSNGTLKPENARKSSLVINRAGLSVPPLYWVARMGSTPLWPSATKISNRHLDEDTNLEDSRNHAFYVYNAGDIETDVILYIPINTGTLLSSISLYQGWVPATTGTQIAHIGFKKWHYLTKGSDLDTHVRFNTSTNLVEGGTMVDGVFNPSGLLYNQFIDTGDFFKLPPGEGCTIFIFGENLDSASTNPIQINYEYLYY